MSEGMDRDMARNELFDDLDDFEESTDIVDDQDDSDDEEEEVNLNKGHWGRTAEFHEHLEEDESNDY